MQNQKQTIVIQSKWNKYQINPQTYRKSEKETEIKLKISPFVHQCDHSPTIKK